MMLPWLTWPLDIYTKTVHTAFLHACRQIFKGLAPVQQLLPAASPETSSSCSSTFAVKFTSTYSGK